MHQMTRLPAEARIRAPFDGARFRFKDDSARFTQHGDERFVDIASPRFGDHLYRVTRVIGGRHREDFAGRRGRRHRPGAPVVGDPRAELVLPVSYVFDTGSFRLKGYSVMVGERPGLRAGGVWNQTCIFCHNTVPVVRRALGARCTGPGAPAYQGDGGRPAAAAPIDAGRCRGHRPRGAARGAAAEPSVSAVGARRAPRRPRDARAALAHGIRDLRARFGGRPPRRGRGRLRVLPRRQPRARRARPPAAPTFEPRSDFLARPARRRRRRRPRAEWINRACARCHQVLFTRYPYTWEGGLRRSRRPGRQPHQLGRGARLPAGRLRPRRCPARPATIPTASDRRAALAALATAAGNRACTGCHAQLRRRRPRCAPTPTTIRRAPAARASACHMPRKNMGLGYELTRYHRIGSPDRPRRGSRAIARSSARSATPTRRVGGAGRRRWSAGGASATIAARCASSTADLRRARAGGDRWRGASRTSRRPRSRCWARRADRRGRRRRPPARQPVPLVRYYAQRALATLGRPCAVDLDRPTNEIAAAAASCFPALSAAGLRSPSPAPQPSGRPAAVVDDED